MASGADERIYIQEAAELLDRRMGTLRKWEAENQLPEELMPERGYRGWRYWTPAQIEGIKQWIIDTERFPGKGLPYFEPPTKEELKQQLAHMRKPRTQSDEE